MGLHNDLCLSGGRCLREVVLRFASEMSLQIHVLNILSPAHGVILGGSGNWKLGLGFAGRNRSWWADLDVYVQPLVPAAMLSPVLPQWEWPQPYSLNTINWAVPKSLPHHDWGEPSETMSPKAKSSSPKFFLLTSAVAQWWPDSRSSCWKENEIWEKPNSYFTLCLNCKCMLESSLWKLRQEDQEFKTRLSAETSHLKY